MLGHIRSALSECRWVTLVGPVGVGKSLLARHACLTTDHIWVDVRTVTDLDDLIRRWLAHLEQEIPPGDAPRAVLLRSMVHEPRLSVLDGILDGAVEGLRDLLESVVAGTPQARLLCTSATSVGAAAEKAVRIDPLPLPGRAEPLGGAAVELFLSRMASAGGRLIDLSRDEATLRRLLDASGGLPMVIEQMAAQAAQAGLERVVAPQSLGEVIAASYAMVDEYSQRACRRLATIDFAVSMDVFAAVAGLPRLLAIGHAAQLQRYSLVEISSVERIRMLAPVRRFAQEVADADDAADADRGLLAWAQQALPEAATGEDPDWLDDVDALSRAIATAAAEPERRDLAYVLTNRAFDTLYSQLRSREALALFEIVLGSGDGPPEVGAQVARRAGICASEVRGTFDGLDLLERADTHAAGCAEPDVQRARTASIRAEMHLDAGQLDQARAQVRLIQGLAGTDSYSLRQARRTLMDVEVSCGNLAAAEELAPLILHGVSTEEEWLAVAARLLLAQIAAEQGRVAEALAGAKATRADAVAREDDRLALLADVLVRQVAAEPATQTPDPEQLPWGVRLIYQLQSARELTTAGDFARAAGAAADVVVLADSAQLGRDGVAARLVLGDALLAGGDRTQAVSTYAAAARRAAACPMPLRVADAFDGIAAALSADRPDHAAKCAGVAAEIRARRGASGRLRPRWVQERIPMPRSASAWVRDGQVTEAGLAAVLRLEDPSGQPMVSPLARLTKAQMAVAELVGAGLTSKEIAERLYLSPRTVDNHLAQIYRRLDIPSRAKLASLMADLT